MAKIKKAIMKAIWSGMCPEWFIEESKNQSEKCDKKLKMVEFFEEESDSLDSIFQMMFTDGS